MLKKIVELYLKINRRYLSSKKVIYKMSGDVLLESCVKEFELKDTIAKEVKEHCLEQGFEIDKILFVNFFEAQLTNKSINLKFDSISKIVVIEDKNELVAQVFMGSWLKFKK